MPGAGSLSRSALNHQSGAATKASGLFTSAFVATLVLALAPLTRYIPKAALAGLLVVAAGRLIDIPRIRYVTKAGVYDAILLFGTLALTFIAGVEYSILIGVIVSVLLFVPRAAKLRVRQLVVTEERIVRERVDTDPPPSSVEIYDLEGELFFGAAPEFEARLHEALVEAKAHDITHIVYRVKRLRNPDAVSLERLEHFLRDSQRQGFTVFLAGIRPDLRRGMERLGFASFFPADRWFFEQDHERDSATLTAVRKAYQLLGIRRPTDTVAYYLV
jgi:SulP family sulfate permease